MPEIDDEVLNELRSQALVIHKDHFLVTMQLLAMKDSMDVQVRRVDDVFVAVRAAPWPPLATGDLLHDPSRLLKVWDKLASCGVVHLRLHMLHDRVDWTRGVRATL